MSDRRHAHEWQDLATGDPGDPLCEVCRKSAYEILNEVEAQLVARDEALQGLVAKWRNKPFRWHNYAGGLVRGQNECADELDALLAQYTGEGEA